MWRQVLRKNGELKPLINSIAEVPSSSIFIRQILILKTLLCFNWLGFVFLCVFFTDWKESESFSQQITRDKKHEGNSAFLENAETEHDCFWQLVDHGFGCRRQFSDSFHNSWQSRFVTIKTLNSYPLSSIVSFAAEVHSHVSKADSDSLSQAVDSLKELVNSLKTVFRFRKSTVNSLIKR